MFAWHVGWLIFIWFQSIILVFFLDLNKMIQCDTKRHKLNDMNDYGESTR